MKIKKVANESFRKAEEEPKNLNESWSNVDDFLDIQENTTPYDVLEAFKNDENLWYPLIKPSEYKQALTEFMKYGEIVRYPEDKIYGWLKTIFRNGCYIDSITALAGHTQWFPFEDVENAYIETEDLEHDYYVFSEFLEKQGFYDWAVLPDGSPAYSDYGLKPLFKVLDEYHEGMSAGEMLVLVNRCLDIVHCRGDFPSAFIEGGSESLRKISNEGLTINKSPLTESIMFNESIAYVSKKDLSDIILKNPTRKEILEYDNPVLKHQDWRIAKDNTGNYYFGSGYDWIHFEMCNALKKQGIDIDVVFSDYDGIASYDSKTNTFYIRDEYGEPEIIEQEFNNSYIKNAFPNAKLEIDAEYDEMLESQNLNESIVYASKKDLSDVILMNPSRKELKDNNIKLARYCYDDEGNFYFGNADIITHNDIIENIKNKLNITLYDDIGFYDVNKNCFYIKGYFADEDEYDKELRSAKRKFSNEPILKQLFGDFNVDVFQSETPNEEMDESKFFNESDFNLDEVLNKFLNEDKPLTESIMFNDEVYDDFQEEYRQLTVWVNPSVDWIRSKLDEAGGFRFLHSLDKNKLYVFTVESGFMHQQVFDMLDFDWSKNGRNVVGVFNPDNSISSWEALADDGEASSSLKLAEELDGDLFKKIYPNGYELTICY